MSVRGMSWSPRPGITEDFWTRAGWLVNRRSRMFAVLSVVRVGSITVWFNSVVQSSRRLETATSAVGLGGVGSSRVWGG